MGSKLYQLFRVFSWENDNHMSSLAILNKLWTVFNFWNCLGLPKWQSLQTNYLSLTNSFFINIYKVRDFFIIIVVSLVKQIKLNREQAEILWRDVMLLRFFPRLVGMKSKFTSVLYAGFLQSHLCYFYFSFYE